MRSFAPMDPSGNSKKTRAAVFAAMLLAGAAAHAAYTVTWNTTGSPGNYLAPVTYDGTSNSGGIRNTTDEVLGVPFTLQGFGDGAQGSRLTLTSVPVAYDPAFYVQIGFSVASGMSFDPAQIRVATQYGLVAVDRNATFQVRSSLDNYMSVIGTSAVDGASGRNPVSGGGGLVNYDQVVDVSSVGPVTGSIGFRLYFQDTNGGVNIPGSIETLPEGIRIVGPDATAIPEPGSLALGLLGALSVLRRRRSSSER